MHSLSRECVDDSRTLALRAAARECRSRCHLHSDRCRELAEGAVQDAVVERSGRAFADCAAFRADLIYYSRMRTLDGCRREKRAVPGLPIDPGEVRPPTILQGDSTPLTLDETTRLARTRLRECIDRLAPLDRRICEACISGLDSDDPQIHVQLDRIWDVLRRVARDSQLWADLRYGVVDFSNPSDPAYQRFRVRLNRMKVALLAGLRAAPDLDDRKHGAEIDEESRT